jgi:hypothetical protein
MYLKVDPEAKNPPPKEVSDIMDRMNTLHGLIDGTNIANASNEGASVSKCGPPEGVPIWEWLPAVFCWIGTILPPTISGGSCGSSPGQNSNSPSTFATPANALDLNRNGVLDGYEIIGSGELRLLNPMKIFGYGESIPLNAELTKDGKLIDIDSFNVVSFNIKKLVLPGNGIGNPAKVVFDRDGTGAISEIGNINSYVNFKPL